MMSLLAERSVLLQMIALLFVWMGSVASSGGLTVVVYQGSAPSVIELNRTIGSLSLKDIQQAGGSIRIFILDSGWDTDDATRFLNVTLNNVQAPAVEICAGSATDSPALLSGPPAIDACTIARGASPYARRLQLTVTGAVAPTVRTKFALNSLLLCESALLFADVSAADVVLNNTAMTRTVLRLSGGSIVTTTIIAPLQVLHQSQVVISGVLGLSLILRPAHVDSLSASRFDVAHQSSISVVSCVLASNETLKYTGVSSLVLAPLPLVSMHLQHRSVWTITKCTCGSARCGLRLALGALQVDTNSAWNISGNTLRATGISSSAALFDVYGGALVVNITRALSISTDSVVSVAYNILSSDFVGLVLRISASSGSALSITNRSALDVGYNSVSVIGRSTPAAPQLQNRSAAIVVLVDGSVTIGLVAVLSQSSQWTVCNNDVMTEHPVATNDSSWWSSLLSVSVHGGESMLFENDSAVTVASNRVSLGQASLSLGLAGVAAAQTILVFELKTASVVMDGVGSGVRVEKNVLVSHAAASGVIGVSGSSALAVWFRGTLLCQRGAGIALASNIISVSRLTGVLHVALMAAMFASDVTLIHEGSMITVRSNTLTFTQSSNGSPHSQTTSISGLLVVFSNSTTSSNALRVSQFAAIVLERNSIRRSSLSITVSGPYHYGLLLCFGTSVTALSTSGVVSVQHNLVDIAQATVFTAGSGPVSVFCGAVVVQVSATAPPSTTPKTTVQGAGAFLQIWNNTATVAASMSSAIVSRVVTSARNAAAGIAILAALPSGPVTPVAYLLAQDQAVIAVYGNTVSVTATNTNSYGILMWLSVSITLQGYSSLSIKSNSVSSTLTCSKAASVLISAGVANLIMSSTTSPQVLHVQNASLVVVTGNVARLVAANNVGSQCDVAALGVAWSGAAIILEAAATFALVVNDVNVVTQTGSNSITSLGGIWFSIRVLTASPLSPPSLQVASRSSFLVDSNTVTIGVSGVGIYLRVFSVQSNTAPNPAALSIWDASTVSISYNAVARASTSALSAAVRVEAVSGDGLSAAIWQKSSLTFAENTLDCSRGGNGLVIRFTSLQTQLVRADVLLMLADVMVAPVVTHASGTSLIGSSALEIVGNDITSTLGDGIAFHVDFSFHDTAVLSRVVLAEGTAPKALLVSGSSSIVVRGNIVRTGGHGILFALGVNSLMELRIPMVSFAMAYDSVVCWIPIVFIN